MNIDELTKNFKTHEELKIFCESQFKQILTLSRRIKDLEEKNAELSKKAKENNSLKVVENKELATTGTSLLIKNDAKTIAEIQLKVLKEMSFERELTLEEAKKVEIFNKIANVVEDKPKTIKADAKTLNTNDLLSLIESDNVTTSK